MPAKRKKTAFERDVAAWMKNPDFREEYQRARKHIAEVDELTNDLLRALDKARVKRGLSKAELARRIGARPEIIRRLFTADGQNPTLSTLTKIALELGVQLELTKAPHRRAS